MTNDNPTIHLTQPLRAVLEAGRDLLDDRLDDLRCELELIELGERMVPSAAQAQMREELARLDAQVRAASSVLGPREYPKD